MKIYSIEIKRLFKQKFIYFFLLAFIFASSAYSYLLSALDLYDKLNVDPVKAGGAGFPEFMMPFYAVMVGPLFMSFITSIYISEDNLAGMLKQPLLHGKTRRDILNSKFLSLCGLSLFMMVSIYCIVNLIGYLKWGNEIFLMPQFSVTLQKFILVTISLVTMEALTILVSLYAGNTVVLICIMFGVLMIDNQICNNFELFSEIVMFNYSTHYYLNINQGNAGLFFKLKGIVYDLLYFLLFYYLANRKIEKIEFK